MAENIISDISVGENKKNLNSPNTKVKGFASVDNTLNSMEGDISYEELVKIPGISTIALKAKLMSSEYSIFQKKDYRSPILGADGEISYQNFKVLIKFISSSGKIVPNRINGLNKLQQHYIENSIKIARYLALLPYVQY